MTVVTNSIRIQAPIGRVWSTISDLGSVYKYHPGVNKSYYTTDQKEGIGATRICELLPIGKVEETALSWEDGRSLSVSVIPVEKAPPFKDTVGTISVEEDGEETVVHMTVDYQLKYGPLGVLADALVVRSQLKKGIPAVLKGLKHFMETGEEITPQVMKNISFATA